MKKEIRLIALDLDGTLFNSRGSISSHNRETIKKVMDAGIAVVISTGRPYVGLPLDALYELGVKYAITANGSAVYELPDRKCLLEDAISPERSASLLRDIYQHNLHLDAFIQGEAYTQASTRNLIENLHISESLRAYIQNSRTIVEDLAAFVVEKQLGVQKLTLNFPSDKNGNPVGRDEILTLLQKYPDLHSVSGGFQNIEINKNGISKARGLLYLCELLHIPVEKSMACGDSQNDYDIVTASGIGVAMSNSEQILLEAADYISRSNDEDGVAYAIEQLVEF